MEPGQDIDTTENTGRKPRSRTGRLIAVVVILTIVAVLLVPGRDDEPKAPEPLPKVERPSLLEEPSQPPPTQTPGESGPDAMATQDQGPGAAARRLIRQLRASPSPDLEKAWLQAQAFEQQGDLDDAFLLYYFAAHEGHGKAALKLARQADPATFTPGGLFEHPDELQAHKWYSRAIQAGEKGAAKALQALHSRVKKAAEAGDAHARRLMLQWE